METSEAVSQFIEPLRKSTSWEEEPYGNKPAKSTEEKKHTTSKGSDDIASEILQEPAINALLLINLDDVATTPPPTEQVEATVATTEIKEESGAERN